MEKPAGHVFLSYVREDSSDVDQLQQSLEAAEIPVWRDTAALGPGEYREQKIRRAITDNTLIFIACFSSRSTARAKSYQNKELLLAIEQLQLRRPDTPWLIPVRFDDCSLPDFELDGRRTLESLQCADLFGEDREAKIAHLVEYVKRLLSQHLPRPEEAEEKTINPGFGQLPETDTHQDPTQGQLTVITDPACHDMQQAPSINANLLIASATLSMQSSQELRNLVRAVETAAPDDKSEWIEWKSGLDLMAENTRATLACHIIGMANRQDEVARFAKGYGYILIGVEPGSRGGVTPVAPADLQAGIASYLGPHGPRWTVKYDTMGRPPVLIIIVDPPQPGDPIHALHRDFGHYQVGDIFVRKLGSTEKADPDDEEYLARLRVARHAGSNTSPGSRSALSTAASPTAYSIPKSGPARPRRGGFIRIAWLVAVLSVLAVVAVIAAVTDWFGKPPTHPHVSATLPAAALLPPFRTQLPGTDTTLLLRPADPLRLFSYLDSKGDAGYLLNPATGHFSVAGRGVIVSPDGWHEAIIGKQDITFVNLRTGQRRSTPGYPGYAPTYDPESVVPAENPQFSPNGRYLLVMGEGADIAIIDTQSPSLSFHMFRPSGIFYMGAWWTSDSAHIIVQVSPDSAAVYNLQGQLVRQLPIGSNTTLIDSAFGRLLYSCPTASASTASGSACVMDITTGKVIARVPHLLWHGSDIGVLGFYDKNYVYGWAGSQLVIRDFSGHTEGVLAVTHQRGNTYPPWLFFSHTPAAAMPPLAAGIPPWGTQLPGTGITLLLRPTDTLRLFSYTSLTGGSYLLNPHNSHYQHAGPYLMFSSNGDTVVISPDGWHEAVIGKNTITFTDLRTGYDRTVTDLKYTLSARPMNTATRPQFSPNGQYLLAMSIGQQNNYAIVINTKTLQHWTLTLPGNDDNGSFWWTPDSAHIVVPTGPDDAEVYDLHGHMLRRLPLGSDTAPLDSAFGLLLYFCPPTVSTPALTSGCVMNVWTGKVIAHVPHLWSPGSSSQQLGLFDSSHVYERARNQIAVHDFQGHLTKVIAIDRQKDDNVPPIFYFSHSS